MVAELLLVREIYSGVRGLSSQYPRLAAGLPPFPPPKRLNNPMQPRLYRSCGSNNSCRLSLRDRVLRPARLSLMRKSAFEPDRCCALKTSMPYHQFG